MSVRRIVPKPPAKGDAAPSAVGLARQGGTTGRRDTVPPGPGGKTSVTRATDAYCRSVPRLQGDRILLRDFLPHDRDSFLALESDEAMFTYMRFRIDRPAAESVLRPRLLQGRRSIPLRATNLVVEDAAAFSGCAGIDTIQDSDSAQFGWYLRSDRWGSGGMTRRTPPGLLLDFAFSALHRAVMWAMADPENVPSLGVFENSASPWGLTDPVQTWRGVRPRVLFTLDAQQWETSPDLHGPSSPLARRETNRSVRADTG